jgi:hypothetical protein
MHTTIDRVLGKSLTVALSIAVASYAAHAQALPDPRAVLARYVQVTNATKLLSSPGQRMKGTFGMPAAGITGQVEGYRDGQGRSLQVITIPAIGQMKEGSEPDFKWSMDPIQGPKIIEGKEFIEAREREDPRAATRDPALVLNAVAVRRDSVGGAPCVVLTLTWKSGRSTNECYSESTGYLLSSESKETTAMGEIAIRITYMAYKPFDGITVPTRTVQNVAGTELVLEVNELVFEAIDPAKLVLPAEIQTLRKK